MCPLLPPPSPTQTPRGRPDDHPPSPLRGQALVQEPAAGAGGAGPNPGIGPRPTLDQRSAVWLKERCRRLSMGKPGAGIAQRRCIIRRPRHRGTAPAARPGLPRGPLGKSVAVGEHSVPSPAPGQGWSGHGHGSPSPQGQASCSDVPAAPGSQPLPPCNEHKCFPQTVGNGPAPRSDTHSSIPRAAGMWQHSSALPEAVPPPPAMPFLPLRAPGTEWGPGTFLMSTRARTHAPTMEPVGLPA